MPDDLGIGGGQRKLVLVLGMHRSGTSAITRGLKVLGVELGDNMIPSHADNVKGFWEDAGFKELNEALLAELGASWHSVGLLPGDGLVTRLAHFHFRALDMLKAKAAQAPVVGLKDPRFCRLLSFWKPIFVQAGLDVAYVIPTRNPLSVARSLQQRNGFALERSLMLWQGHLLASVLGAEGSPSVVVDYDRLMGQPAVELGRIAHALSLPQPEPAALAEYAADYLDGSLRHASYTVSDLRQNPAVPGFVTETFEWLVRLSKDEVAGSGTEAREFFLKKQEQLGQFSFLLRYLDDRESLLAAKDAQLAQQEKVIHGHVESIRVQSATIAERNQAVSERNQVIVERNQVIVERNQVIVERNQVIAEQSQAIAEKNQAIAEKASLVNERSALLSQKERALAEQRQALATREATLHERDQALAVVNRELHEVRRLYADTLAAPEWGLAKKLGPVLAIRRRIKGQSRTTPAMRVLRESGLFDPDWYQQQVGDLGGQDAVAHYTGGGWKQGLSPHPSFDVVWYREQYLDLATLKVSPLQHYLEHGWKELRQPHPAFPVEWYLGQNPDIARSGLNPLVHYQRKGGAEGRDPHPLFAARWYLRQYRKQLGPSDSPLSHYFKGQSDGQVEPHPLFKQADYLAAVAGQPRLHPHPFLDCLQRVERFMASPPAQAYMDRGILASFDVERARQFVQGVRRNEAARLASAVMPKVSIIMPTHNRLDLLPMAVKSVLDQSYPVWELLIVDDGSEDGTAEYVVGHCTDSRIRFQRTPAKGVCHARNVGLAAATGEWFAYLDSDNAWAVGFLELMLAHLQQEGADFAYSAVRMFNGQRDDFRFCAFDADSLLVKNFIDLNAIVHHRRLYDTVGGFDESLERMVDWDVVIRYAQQAEKISPAYFIGVHYDNRPQPDRITVNKPLSWRYAVMNKHMIHWEAQRAQCPQRDPNLVSVVIPVYGQLALTRQCVVSLFAVDAGLPFELVVVDNGSAPEVLRELYFWSLGHAGVRLVRNPDNYNFALGCNIGFAASRGRHVVFLNNDTEVTDGWLKALVSPLQDNPHIGAVQPRLLFPDGRVQCAGVVFSARSPIPYPLYVDCLAEASHVLRSRAFQAVSAACMAVRSEDFAALRGFDPLYVNGQEDMDFCLRLRALGKQAWYEAGSVVVHHESRTPGRGKHVEQNRRLFVQRWQGRYHADDEAIYQADGFQVVGWRSDGVADAALVGYAPLLRAASQPAQPRLFALKVPCPTAAAKAEWGDYHFARSLGMALQRAGHAFRIDFLDEWGRGVGQADEVNLVLRGLSRFEPRPNQLNLMWMISHPDKVSLDELRSFDHVFVASTLYAERLAADLGGKVSPLLQCTDPNIFYPGEVDQRVAHELLFVGNSRNQFREVVRLALDSGLKPAVYGTRWQQFVGAEVLKGENIPNAELGGHYRSAGVVLNDHWPDMRDKGFVSNRVFDVLACGVPLVSDRIQGLPEALQALLCMYADQSSLVRCVDGALGEGYAVRQARFRLALEVQAKHSFDERASEIIRLVSALDCPG